MQHHLGPSDVDTSQPPAAKELSSEVAPHQPFHPAAPREAVNAPARSRRTVWFSIGLWLPVAIIFAFTVATVGPYVAERFQYSITRGKQRAQYDLATVALRDRPLEKISLASQLISQRIGPSLVHINTTNAVDDPPENEAQRFFRRRRQSHGQGSGVIVDESGYIVTNYHVVRGSREIQVALSDGRQMRATVVGFDELTDLAVLKIPTDHLIVAQWGDSDDLDVGSLVWAAGSPFGLEQSITFGILSAKHRAGKAGTSFQDFLQTDAAVNPGNSGGPLVNSQGLVVGINTAIVGETYQGISFAVPSNVARHVYQKIRAEGRVARGWLGVGLDEVTAQRAAQLGMEEVKGVFVVEVVDDADGPSPANRAGVKNGDVILRWNGKPTDTPTVLSQRVAATPVGSQVEVVVFRDGQELSLDVTVGERPRRLN